MARADTLSLTISKVSGALGAEVSGVDLRRVDDALFDRIHRAWIDHQVLLFRGQTLSDDELVAFSRHFGVLDHAPIQETGRRSGGPHRPPTQEPGRPFVGGYPKISVAPKVRGGDGKPIGSLGTGEAVW